jgi:PKD repeat protein
MKTIKTLFAILAAITVIASGMTALADSGTLSASFVASVNTGPAPLTVEFTDESGGNPTGWQWDFGDGSYSKLQSPTYTYNTPGKYTVTLTVTDGVQSDTMSGDVVITNPLVTTPTPGPDYGRIILVPIRDPHHVRPPHDDKTPVQKPPHKDQPPAKKPPQKEQPPVKKPPVKDQPVKKQPVKDQPVKKQPVHKQPPQKSPGRQPTDNPKHR